jgi:hypothetical protein
LIGSASQKLEGWLSVVPAFFDRFLFGLGPLDLASCGQSLVAQHTNGFDFRALAAA